MHWKPIQIVPLKINWFLSAAFSYWKSIQISHWSKRFHAFALVDQRHFSIDFAIYLKLLLYWKAMKFFLLKINWLSSFKNYRISLHFLYRDFQIHFSLDFAILLKLPFLSIENQLIYQLQKPLRQRFLQYFWSPYLKKWNIPLIYLKNWKSLFLFEEIEFPFFIWRNWKSLFLFEEIESPFFIWRNEIPLFYLKN